MGVRLFDESLYRSKSILITKLNTVMLKKYLIPIIASIMLLGFSVGCETMEGAGRDLQSAGESLEESAQ